MDLLIRRAATYTAEHDSFDTHRIGSAEDSAHVMLTAHVIQHNHNRQFVRFAVLLHIHAPHLGCRQFFAHNVKGKCTWSTRVSSSISEMKSSCSGNIRPSSRVAKVLMVDSSISAIIPIISPSSIMV